MLRHDGPVKVLEFGPATLIAIESSEVEAEAETKAPVRTKAGIVMGTASYMSPSDQKNKSLRTTLTLHFHCF